MVGHGGNWVGTAADSLARAKNYHVLAGNMVIRGGNIHVAGGNMHLSGAGYHVFGVRSLLGVRNIHVSGGNMVAGGGNMHVSGAGNHVSGGRSLLRAKNIHVSAGNMVVGGANIHLSGVGNHVSGAGNHLSGVRGMRFRAGKVNLEREDGCSSGRLGCQPAADGKAQAGLASRPGVASFILKWNQSIQAGSRKRTAIAPERRNCTRKRKSNAHRERKELRERRMHREKTFRERCARHGGKGSSRLRIPLCSLWFTPERGSDHGLPQERGLEAASRSASDSVHERTKPCRHGSGVNATLQSSGSLPACFASWIEGWGRRRVPAEHASAHVPRGLDQIRSPRRRVRAREAGR
jgi:hypothetical protein